MVGYRKAILVACGWLQDDGMPSKHCLPRLDKALELYNNDSYVIVMWRGTLYKPPVLDNWGFPIDEAVSAARYLLDNWLPNEDVKIERFSFDTLGSLCFTKIFHLDPLWIQDIKIVTSEFHMERVSLIRERIMSLTDVNIKKEYIITSNHIDNDFLNLRMQKEKEWVENIRRLMAEIWTWNDLLIWLFSSHAAYSMSGFVFKTNAWLLNSY